MGKGSPLVTFFTTTELRSAESDRAMFLTLHVDAVALHVMSRHISLSDITREERCPKIAAAETTRTS
jgi:hypothetical protein